MAIGPSPYTNQWATIYAIYHGPTALQPHNYVQTLRESIGGVWESPQLPSTDKRSVTVKEYFLTDPVENISFIEFKIVGGIYHGLTADNDTRYVTAFKWNVRKRDRKAVSEYDVRALRVALRLRIAGYSSFESTQVAMHGQPFSPDFGAPPTPALPAEPAGEVPAPSPAEAKPIWPWLLGGAAVLGLAALKK